MKPCFEYYCMEPDGDGFVIIENMYGHITSYDIMGHPHGWNKTKIEAYNKLRDILNDFTATDGYAGMGVDEFLTKIGYMVHRY